MPTSFEQLNLDKNLISGLKKEEITAPTPIQTAVIPLALIGKNIIGQSITGSGKTLAYLLPVFERIDTSKREMQAIILAPTHELVMQIDQQIKLLSLNAEASVTSTTIIGQASIKRQMEKLKKKPHIVVGSAGRILELIKKKKISAHTIKTIVIDEGDRMLDQNNVKEVKDIIKTTMRDTQLMAFSATIHKDTIATANDLMKDPEIIKIEENPANPNIEHIYFTADKRDKLKVLRKLIASTKPEKAIVFLNKNEEIQLLTEKLQYHNIKAFGIYGNASRDERKNALQKFQNGKIQLLVASDLAARGLDVKGVTHIFNLDLPENPKEYLHRVGRTGRAGESGTAISIVTPKELTLLKRFQRKFDIKIQEKQISKGKIQ